MAKTANEGIKDYLTRHQIYLLRYGNHVRNEINSMLKSTEGALKAKIHDAVTTGKNTKAVDFKRIQVLQAGLSKIRTQAWGKVSDYMQKEMIRLGYQEPIQLSKAITDILPVTVNTVMPSRQMLKSIATERPFQGALLKDWADTMKDADIRRISDAVQVGMVSGQTAPQIAKSIVGTAELEGKDGVTQMTRNQVQSVVRTAIQSVTNASREEWFSENSDIVDEEYFVATLDSRTTPVCQANDGKKFPVGQGPMPPLHFGCRSLRVVAFDGILLGDRPANPTTERQLLKEYAEKEGLEGINKYDDLPRGTKGAYNKWATTRKRELIGPVPAHTTYNDWLRSQSTEFQNEVLGVKKGELFRGGMTLDKFVDLNGKPLTLDQLVGLEDKTIATLAPRITDPNAEPDAWSPDTEFNQKFAYTKDHRNLPEYIRETDNKSLRIYTGDEYASVNAFLKRDEVLGLSREELEGIVSDLKGIMKPTSQDYVLFRSIQVSDVEGLLTDLRKSGVFEEKAFVSTSRSSYISRTEFGGENGITFMFRYPSGKKAIVTNSGEAELILPPGTRFRVRKIHENAELKYSDENLRTRAVIELEIIDE